MSVLLLLCNKLWGLSIVIFVGCYNNLATVLKDQGDLKQAKEYHERAFAIKEQILGPQHPDVTSSYNNFAALLCDKGDLEKA